MMMMIRNKSSNNGLKKKNIHHLVILLLLLLSCCNNNNNHPIIGFASASSASTHSALESMTNSASSSTKVVDCNSVGINEYYNSQRKQHHFQLTSSSLYLSANRGFQYVWDDLSNMLKYWSRMNPERLERFHMITHSQAFSYVDLYGGHSIETNCLPIMSLHSSQSIWSVVPWDITFYLDDKLTFGQAAKSAGLEVNYIPRTFETRQDAIDTLLMDGDSDSDSDDSNNGIFFVKDRFGTKGMGITLHQMNELSTVDVPKWSIIQEGLTQNLALFENNRKLTARLFIVIFEGSVYIHHSGTIKVQHSTYDSTSVEENSQVSHDGYADPYILDLYNDDGLLDVIDFHAPFQHRMTPPVRNWGPKFDKSRVVNSSMWLDNFKEMTETASYEFLKPIIDYTIDNDKTYSILGIDVIPMIDGTLQMIEINHYPNFYRFDIMTDILLTIFNLEDLDEQLSKRLIKVYDTSETSESTATTSTSTSSKTTSTTATATTTTTTVTKNENDDDEFISSTTTSSSSTTTTTTPTATTGSFIDDVDVDSNNNNIGNVIVVEEEEEEGEVKIHTYPPIVVDPITVVSTTNNSSCILYGQQHQPQHQQQQQHIVNNGTMVMVMMEQGYGGGLC